MGAIVEVVAGACMAETMAACTLSAAYAVAVRAISSRSVAARLIATYVVACWLLNVLFVLLINLGAFRPLVALPLLAAIALIAWRHLCGPREIFASLAQDYRRLARFWRAIPPHCRLVWMPFLGFSVLLVLRALLLPLLGWDSWTYHGVKAGLWVQGGGHFTYDAPGGWEYYRYFFPGGEIISAWFMLPFHGDLIATMPDVFHWFAIGAALAALSREFHGTRRNTLPVVAVALALPALSFFVGGGKTELALHASILAAAFFTLRFWRTRRTGNLCLSAAAMGFAAATKVTALPYLAALVLVCGIRESVPRWRVGMRWSTVLTCTVLALLPLAPWLVTCYLECGYPFGSIPVSLGPIQLGFLPPNLAWLMAHPWPSNDTLRGECGLLLTLVSFKGVSLTPLIIPLGVWGVLGLVRSAMRHEAGSFLAVSCILATAVSFYQPAFASVRFLWPGNCARFLMIAVLLLCGTALSASPLRGRAGRVVRGYLWLASTILILFYMRRHFVWPGYLEELPALAAVGVVLLAATVSVVAFVRRYAHIPTIALLVGTAISAVFLAPSLMLVRQWFRGTAYAKCWVTHPNPTYWVPCLAILDKAAPGQLIAATRMPVDIAHGWWVYPLLGSRLEHRICYVSPDKYGRIIPHHPDHLRGAEFSRDVWRERIVARDVNFVMSYDATMEMDWMEAMPDMFRRLCGDGREWGFYEVLR